MDRMEQLGALHFLDDGQAGSRRAGGIIFVRGRIAEVRQQSIPEILGNVAIEGADRWNADLLVRAHQLA